MENRDLELIHSVRSYYVCAPYIFVTKCFLISIVYKVKNFAINNNQSSCWSQLSTEIRAKEFVTNWRFVQQKKKVYYNIKSNWVLEQRFNCKLYFGIGQGSDKIPHICNRLIFYQWILGSGDLKFIRWGFCLARGFSPFVNK